jgi:ring-1,2-phenylacetyl-CoA epoxidase subunit PaaC
VTGIVLELGDDALIAAQRLSEWCARAPQLEEDVALANITLDLLGQARALLAHAGELEGAGRGESRLAYLREPAEFRNAQLVELPNGDFATTIAKLLFFAVFQSLRYTALSGADDPVLAAIAGKAAVETRYHVEHAHAWTVRLGDGTAESKHRMQAAVDDVWPFTHGLFEPGAPGFAPETLRAAWTDRVESVLREATLERPADDWTPTGGRHGEHTEAFSYLVQEMQGLHRAHPGARW